MERDEVLQLVILAQQGDADAFEALCDHKAGDILFLCTRLMGNTADGEDAAQEVLIHMHAGLPRLREPVTFWAWINRIVYNTCYTRLDNKKKIINELSMFTHLQSVEEQDEDFLPQAYAERGDLREILSGSLEALPYKHKTALYMYYYEQLTVREMSLALKMSEKAVYKLLGRARGSLKKQLDAQPELPRTSNAGIAATVLSQALAQEAQGFLAQSAWQYTLPTVAVGAGAAGAAGAAGSSLLSALAQPLSTAGGAALATTLTAAAVAVSVGVSVVGTTGGGHPASSLQPPAVATEQVAEPDVPYSIEESLHPSIPEASDGSSLPPSGLEPAEADEQTTDHGAVQVSLQGAVGFQNREGATVPGAGRYAAGMRVSLVCDGTQLASGMVGADGGYTLSFTAPAEGAVCELSIATDASFVPAAANAGGTRSFAYGGALPTLYITDDQAPTGAIEFEGANLERVPGAHGNPAAAVLLWSDESETTIAWQLVQNGQTLASGTGAHALLSLPAAEQMAWYTLSFTLCDAAGNTTTVSRDFYTVT